MHAKIDKGSFSRGYHVHTYMHAYKHELHTCMRAYMYTWTHAYQDHRRTAAGNAPHDWKSAPGPGKQHVRARVTHHACRAFTRERID